jgi:hypothetical protein
MYLSLGKAAKEAGVAKSTISKALSSGKLSYREKKFERLQDRSCRTFPGVSEIRENRCGRTRVERLATGSSRRGNHALFGQIRDPARRIKESHRGKSPPHHRSRSRPRAAWRGPPLAYRELAGRARPAPKAARGSDRHRQAADRRGAKQAVEVQRTFWQRVFRRKPAMAAETSVSKSVSNSTVCHRQPEMNLLKNSAMQKMLDTRITIYLRGSPTFLAIHKRS